MGFVAEYEIGCEQLPLVTVAAAVPDATLNISMVASADGHTPFIVRVADGPAPDVERAFESADFVAEYALVGDGGTRRYKVEPSVGMEEQLGDHVDDLSALRALATTDSVVDQIRVTPTGWVQRGWFDDRETLDQFRSFWQRNGEFSLRRLARDDDGSPADGLTDRQHEALVAAYELGYFEIPRTTSLECVAADLDITASSLSERLRRAQTHLVEETVDLNGGRPASE